MTIAIVGANDDSQRSIAQVYGQVFKPANNPDNSRKFLGGPAIIGMTVLFDICRPGWHQLTIHQGYQ